MSENTTWRDIIEASDRLESNLDSYGRGYKKGWKDAREHAKTLRDPDRLAEIQHLQEALRKKNEKYRRLRERYKQLKDAKRPRTRAYIERVGLWYGDPWEVTVMHGPRWHNSEVFPTHSEALAWALEQVKEAGV